MPTGYTSCIEKGVTFEEFAMGCARAFGACVTMREESSDKKIPDEFKPSDYHKKEIIRIQKEMAQLKKMSSGMCSALAIKERNKEIKNYQSQITKKALLRKKYDAMLDQVSKYKVPDTHLEFKAFMLRQIKESIENDCIGNYYQDELNDLLSENIPSGDTWREAKIQELKEDLGYQTKEDKEEIERVSQRNKWIKDLRKSLCLKH